MSRPAAGRWRLLGGDSIVFADAIASISESIFPIFFVQESADGPIMGVCGTGFFVDDRGLFVTADHFMTPAPDGCTHYFYGNVPDNVLQPALEIERIANDPQRDLFLGRVERGYSRPVASSLEPLRAGDMVCLSGYPMALVASNPRGGFTGNVRRYWQPTFVIDATRTQIGDRVYDGHILQHACLPGMSGGPVFDVHGTVRGMGMATLTRSIPDPVGPPTVVTNGIMIGVAEIHALVAVQCGQVA